GVTYLSRVVQLLKVDAKRARHAIALDRSPQDLQTVRHRLAVVIDGDARSLPKHPRNFGRKRARLHPNVNLPELQLRHRTSVGDNLVLLVVGANVNPEGHQGSVDSKNGVRRVHRQESIETFLFQELGAPFGRGEGSRAEHPVLERDVLHHGRLLCLLLHPA
ncbi:unnamed protein product, partial [Laminaria digitata]